MDPWRGKWAMVTGASAGIGAALARELAAGGANLVLTARRGVQLSALADELSVKHHIQAETLVADLSQRDAPGQIFAFTEGRHISVDLLANNAGFGAYGEFHRVPAERFLDMIQVNISAVVHLTHLYLPGMISRRRGDVHHRLRGHHGV
jgi:short-subunit dehydrogenase